MMETAAETVVWVVLAYGAALAALALFLTLRRGGPNMPFRLVKIGIALIALVIVAYKWDAIFAI